MYINLTGGGELKEFIKFANELRLKGHLTIKF